MKLLITNNRQLITCLLAGKAKRKAFTLMEILIAASIFAIIMVIATGILGQSSSFRSKIKAQRDVSEETKRLADMITRDVRSANYKTAFGIVIETPATIYNFKNGLAFLKFNTSSPYWETRYNATPSTDTNDANVLMIKTKDTFIIYGSSFDHKRVCYDRFPATEAITQEEINTHIQAIGTCGDYTGSPATPLVSQITSSSLDVTLSFGGFLPDDNHLTGQPYVVFNIIAETKNYSSVPVNQRATMTIRSAVTARSFAN